MDKKDLQQFLDSMKVAIGVAGIVAAGSASASVVCMKASTANRLNTGYQQNFYKVIGHSHRTVTETNCGLGSGQEVGMHAHVGTGNVTVLPMVTGNTASYEDTYVTVTVSGNYARTDVS